jgi:hypothetical protein
MLFAGVGRKPISGSRAATTAEERTATAPGAGRTSEDTTTAALLESPDDLQRFMRNVLADDMEVPAESLPYGESLLHLGVNSLSAMRLCNQIKSQLQLSLSMADVLCGKSLQELAQQILQMMQSAGNRISPAVAASAGRV